MKNLFRLTLVAVAGGLLGVLLSGQSSLKTPTPEEATTTCLTLERLLNIAAHQHQPEDAAALSRAFKVAAKYVPDPSSIKGAIAYVGDFDAQNPQLKVVGPGYTWRTAADIAEFSSDDKHQGAVIIVDKTHDLQVLHSDMDAKAIRQSMVQHGTGIGIGGGH